MAHVRVGEVPTPTPPVFGKLSSVVDGQCDTVSGGVSDGSDDAINVEVRFDDKKWQDAPVKEDRFEVRQCGLEAKEHSVRVRATNSLGQVTESAPLSFKISVVGITATLSQHLSANRLSYQEYATYT